MMKMLKSFFLDVSGATALEYGFIAGLIALVIITALTTMGSNLATLFANIAGKVPTK